MMRLTFLLLAITVFCGLVIWSADVAYRRRKKEPKVKPHRSIEEKYEFLLKHLKVTNVDWWENDAMIELEKPIYLQFPTNLQINELTPDRAVEEAMGNHFVSGPKTEK